MGMFPKPRGHRCRDTWSNTQLWFWGRAQVEKELIAGLCGPGPLGLHHLLLVCREQFCQELRCRQEE